MEYLNTRVANDVLWWHESEGFAFDCNRLQSEFLDKYFEKTKFKSFIRSLNRWGFRRTFYVELPRTIYTFSHPLFKRGEPELARKMKMVSYSRQQQSEMEDFNRRWHAREANKPSDILTIQGIKSHEKSEVTQTTHFTALAPVSAAAMSQLVGGALTEHRVLPHPAQPAGLASQNDSVQTVVATQNAAACGRSSFDICTPATAASSTTSTAAAACTATRATNHCTANLDAVHAPTLNFSAKSKTATSDAATTDNVIFHESSSTAVDRGCACSATPQF